MFAVFMLEVKIEIESDHVLYSILYGLERQTPYALTSVLIGVCFPGCEVDTVQILS